MAGDFTGNYFGADERLLKKHVKRMPSFFLMGEETGCLTEEREVRDQLFLGSFIEAATLSNI